MMFLKGNSVFLIKEFMIKIGIILKVVIVSGGIIIVIVLVLIIWEILMCRRLYIKIIKLKMCKKKVVFNEFGEYVYV